jgi:hypothetical protein
MAASLLWLPSLRMLPKNDFCLSLVQVQEDGSWMIEQEILKFIELHQLEAVRTKNNVHAPAQPPSRCLTLNFTSLPSLLQSAQQRELLCYAMLCYAVVFYSYVELSHLARLA